MVKRKTDWKKMARLSGLSVEVLKSALRGIPSGRRRRAIIATLMLSEGSERTSSKGGAKTFNDGRSETQSET